MTQYIKVSSEEQLFGAKNLLETQASILMSIQHLENYQNLRAEELRLKIMFKKILAEAKEDLIALNKLLPPSPIPKEKKEKVKEVVVEVQTVPKRVKITRLTKEEPERTSSLEKELEEIRNRLAKLS